MKTLRNHEIESLLKADGPTRYAHFVSQVADWEQVWGLQAPNGWVSLSDATEMPMFPVWPHEVYALLSATDAWADAVPTAIDVHEWTENWLPGLAKDSTRVAVFPTLEGRGVVIDPFALQRDIRAELERVE